MSQPPPSTGGSEAFSKLHSKLQEPIYQMGWPSLRPIQRDAIHAVLDGNDDLIIAAKTAAGKTEAAFLPILSAIVDDHQGSVRAIYAGPLKALINDQFLRLERLCEIAEIPVHKWHGDVAAGPKKRLLERPSGVLLITPESIESLFVNHPQRLPAIFSRLEFFVIDEMHSFLGNERGAHLRSLMTRLEAKSRLPLRRIGLSATLGDPNAAKRWLRPGDPDRVRLLEDNQGKKVALRLLGYRLPFKTSKPSVKKQETEETEEALPAADSLQGDVFEAFYGKSALVFGNRKDRIEACADHAKRIAESRGLPNLFRVHHGSLSKGERELTEDDLRSGQPIATFCSSTLEMGIDVGSVKLAGQIGPPWSVNSLAQRLGRSGRKAGEASEILIYVEEEDPQADDSIFKYLFLGLLQATAMTELMLEKWSEPPEVDRLHLSTLVQQTLSRIAETGGIEAQPLHDDLIAGGAFPTVDKPTFIKVLRSMGEADLIEQMPEGPLILGILGEKIVRSRDFYMAFEIKREFRVVHKGQGKHIGNVEIAPDLENSPNPFLILAGRRWKILEVNRERMVILVEPSPAGRAPAYLGTQGHDVHPKVRERMRALLFRDDVPKFLNSTAVELLNDARKVARENGLANLTFLEDGPDTLWFTWTGSRIQNTLLGLGLYLCNFKVQNEQVALRFPKTTATDVRNAYLSILEQRPTPEGLAACFPNRVVEKYESFLSDELQSQVFASHCLDLDGATRLIERLAYSRSADD